MSAATGRARDRRSALRADAVAQLGGGDGRAGIAKSSTRSGRSSASSTARAARADTPVGWRRRGARASSTPFGSCQERKMANSSAPTTKTTSPYCSPRPASRARPCTTGRRGRARSGRARPLEPAGEGGLGEPVARLGVGLDPLVGRRSGHDDREAREPEVARSPPRRARGGRCGAGRTRPREGRSSLGRPARATRPRSRPRRRASRPAERSAASISARGTEPRSRPVTTKPRSVRSTRKGRRRGGGGR